MAQITGLTAERMREIEAASIVDGTIDASGHLILTRYDGQTIDAGDAMVAVPPDAVVQYLPMDSVTETTPPGSYPDGISLFWMSGDTNATDWPTFAGKWGTLHTINWNDAYSGQDTNQVWSRLGNSITPEQWIRTGNGNGWSAWKRLATTDDVVQLLVAKAITEPSTSYPLGVSVMEIASGSGWTPTELGTVVTFNKSDYRAFQLLQDTSTGLYFRRHHTPSGGWGVWNKVLTDTSQVLDINKYGESTSITSYPAGISNMAVTSGWTLGSGTVVTTKTVAGSDRHFQEFHQYNTNRTWKRYYYNNAWGAWSRILHADFVNSTAKPVAGSWYRISKFDAVQGTNPAKASAEFIVTTDGSGSHNILRIRASVAFNDSRGTLSIEECSGYGATPVFTKARIVTLNGTYAGHALELYCGLTISDISVQMAVKHDDWPAPSNPTTLTRWGNLGFFGVPATPVTPETVLMQRGIGYTGEWRPPTLTGGWVNYGAGYEPASYKMDPGGRVFLKGLIKSGVVDDNGGSPIFTLPEGCRPGNRNLFSVNAGGNTMGRIDVLTDGRVIVAGGVNSYQSMDGINFLAIQ